MKNLAEGATVLCVAPYLNKLTKGKAYVVEKYEAPCEEPGGLFTWPAYVKIACDDSGHQLWCHAHRFTED